MPSPNARRAAALLVLVACAIRTGDAVYYQPPSASYGASYDGGACRPPFGYRHNVCGVAKLLNRTVEPACEYLWGPNVCLFREKYLTNETEYRYKEYCDWTYSHYYYRWIRQCNYVCQPTAVCTDEEQEVERDYEQCCPGFEPRPPSTKTHYDHYSHYSYYTPINRDPIGCPVAKGNNLLECLQTQGLDQFIAYLNKSTSYLNLLSTNGSRVTVLAPTNAAFKQALALQLIPGLDGTGNVSMIIGNHIILDNITYKNLEKFRPQIFTGAEGQLLHSVSITFDDYSFFSSGHYNSYGGRTSLNTVIIPFINGAQVVNHDACNTANGSLQIIDMVLLPSNLTIAAILRLDPAYSQFMTALDSVNLLKFLDNPNVSRTVFAIQNEVFDMFFPESLRTCLSMYMRRPYNDLWLYHIGDETHYSSSLALKDFFYTLLLQYIRINVDKNGTIFLGPDRVQIVAQNTPARNGVIHCVDRVLIPPNFSYGMCQQFVPTTPPPTTPPVITTSPPSPAPSPSPDPSPSPSPDPSPSPSPPPPSPSPSPVGLPGAVNPFIPGP